jgi:hypothetical protein
VLGVLVVLVVLTVLVLAVLVLAVLVAASVAQQMVLIAAFVGLSLMFFWVEVVRAWAVHHHRNWNIANIQTYLS